MDSMDGDCRDPGARVPGEQNATYAPASGSASYATPAAVTAAVAPKLDTATAVTTYAPITGSSAYASNDSITGRSPSGARRLDTSWVTAWFTTFQTGHDWSASGGDSHASHNFNDTSDGYLGPQSESLTTLGTAGSGAYIEKTGLSLNMTGKRLVIPLKLSDWIKAGTFVVYLGTDASGYANAYQ